VEEEHNIIPEILLNNLTMVDDLVMQLQKVVIVTLMLVLLLKIVKWVHGLVGACAQQHVVEEHNLILEILLNSRTMVDVLVMLLVRHVTVTLIIALWIV